MNARMNEGMLPTCYVGCPLDSNEHEGCALLQELVGAKGGEYTKYRYAQRALTAHLEEKPLRSVKIIQKQFPSALPHRPSLTIQKKSPLEFVRGRRECCLCMILNAGLKTRNKVLKNHVLLLFIAYYIHLVARTVDSAGQPRNDVQPVRDGRGHERTKPS